MELHGRRRSAGDHLCEVPYGDEGGAVKDPNAPEVLAWLGTLPLTDRLVTLHAVAIAIPALQHSRSWKARISAARDALGPNEVELGYILRAAERRSARLKEELAE
jgi:hypothetical protein